MLNDLWKSAHDLAKSLNKKNDDKIIKDLIAFRELNEIDATEIITAMAPTPVYITK